jgi:hypothetical protein
MASIPWNLIQKVLGIAVDEAMDYVREKLKNGGNHDSTGTGKTE